VEERDESSNDDMSYFLDDDDPEQRTAEREEAALSALDISKASVREDGVLVMDIARLRSNPPSLRSTACRP
jgi:hypothetical protein